MRELVLATITDQPDIEVVREIQDEKGVLQALEETAADFLILASDACTRRPGFCGSILQKFPHLKILALAPERESSVFYWASLDVHSDRVETSEAGVLNALRSGRVGQEILGGQA